MSQFNVLRLISVCAILLTGCATYTRKVDAVTAPIAKVYMFNDTSTDTATSRDLSNGITKTLAERLGRIHVDATIVDNKADVPEGAVMMLLLIDLPDFQSAYPHMSFSAPEMMRFRATLVKNKGILGKMEWAVNGGSVPAANAASTVMPLIEEMLRAKSR